MFFITHEVFLATSNRLDLGKLMDEKADLAFVDKEMLAVTTSVAAEPILQFFKQKVKTATFCFKQKVKTSGRLAKKMMGFVKTHNIDR